MLGCERSTCVHLIKISLESIHLTKGMAVVIFVPPDAPTASRITLLWSTIMVGVIEDMGRFPGSMKLLGDGSTPK